MNTPNTSLDTGRLKSIIERIERMEEEKQNISEDIKQIYSEAKAQGYETKALRQVIKIRKIVENPKLKNKMEEEQYWIDAYKTALGIE